MNRSTFPVPFRAARALGFPCTATLAAALCLGGAAACVTPDDEATPGDDGELVTSEASQALSVFNWTGSAQLPGQSGWTQLVTFNNRIFMAHSGSDGAIRWRERLGTNSWSAPVDVPGQRTSTGVSLAAFNGFIYMIRGDRDDITRLWLSRFDPASGAWSAAFLLPYTSYAGPPAMAAYNGELHLIGVTPSTRKLWHARMTTGESLSTAVPMEGHYSYSRVSATAYGCALYIAHRAGAGAAVVYNLFNGTSWSYDRYIPAGPGGADVQAYEPVIAQRSGYLHLVHRNTTSNADSPLWWTYFDGVSWAPELQLNQRNTYRPSLTTGGEGLVLASSVFYPQISEVRSYSLEYVQPLPTRPPLPCFIVVPPIGVGLEASDGAAR